MLCFGGRETYLVWGKVKWYEEKDCPLCKAKVPINTSVGHGKKFLEAKQKVNA